MKNNIKEYNEEQKLLIARQQRTFIDRDTGEIFEADQIIKRYYGTKQFWKVYLFDFLAILGIFDSRQVDIFVYIIENTEPANNTFCGTYKSIQNALGCSPGTVAKIMKKLQEHNFIKKIYNSVWQVNPNIMMKGSEFKKSLIINYYDDTPKKEEKNTNIELDCYENTYINGYIDAVLKKDTSQSKV